jgi:hypothetical protein
LEFEARQHRINGKNGQNAGDHNHDGCRRKLAPLNQTSKKVTKPAAQ